MFVITALSDWLNTPIFEVTPTNSVIINKGMGKLAGGGQNPSNGTNVVLFDGI